YTQERAGAKRPALLRGYLEHAVYRLESDGRPDWAARIITHALVPLVADEIKAPATEVTDLLARAAALAVQARTPIALKAAFLTGSKLAYAGTVTTLNEFEPPAFAKRAADAPAPAAAPPPKKKAPAKRSSKKKAAS